MNKQQLAAKIWESANKMRSKIEANEYKDYILGFIFYKFLSEKEVKYLKANEWTDEYISEYLTEEDSDTVENVQKSLGYFIAYDNLFSTWLAKGSDFSVQDVRDALSAFSRLINPTHKFLRASLIPFKQVCLSWVTVLLRNLNLSATLFSLSKIFLWTVSRDMMFSALFMNI